MSSRTTARIVEWYEGGKGRERPARVEVDGRHLAVKEVLASRLVEDAATSRRRRVFRVRLEDGRVVEVWD